MKGYTHKLPAKDVAKAYKKIRALQPHTTAKHCLYLAQDEVRVRLGLTPAYPGDEVTIDLPFGDYIVAKMTPDDHNDSYDIEEETGGSLVEVRQYNDSIPEGWMNREGQVLHDALFANHSFKRKMVWWTYEGGSIDQFRDHYHKSMSRHDAWLRARKAMKAIYEGYRILTMDGFYGCEVVMYDTHGNEIDSDFCSGFDSKEGCSNHVYEIILNMMCRREMEIKKMVSDAKEELTKINRDTECLNDLLKSKEEQAREKEAFIKHHENNED